MSQLSESKAVFSIPSILAILAAFLSFYSGAFWGFFWAGAAIFFGLIGMVFALAPKIRGGIVSVLAVAMGLIGIIAAFVKIF